METLFGSTLSKKEPILEKLIQYKNAQFLNGYFEEKPFLKIYR